MKWFKHLSGSLNDSFIFELIEKFGGDGYLVFFGTLEAMTDEFDIYNPGYSCLSIKKLMKNFQLSRQKTVKILEFCNQKARESWQKTGRKLAENCDFLETFQKTSNEKLSKTVGFFISINENSIELYCPRLKDLTDEYTAKRLKQLSGQTPDQVPTLSGLTPEQEAEEEEDIKESPIVVTKNEKPAADLSSKKHFKDIVSSLQLKTIDRHCKTLGKHFKVNFYQWVQKSVNKGYRPDAIILALNGLWEHKAEANNPIAYLEHILTVEHQNLNENDHMAEHQARKDEEMRIGELDLIKNLTKDPGKKK